MNYKEALFEIIKTCQREQDVEDEPALTKKILEILGKLDDQKSAIGIVVAMSKSAISDDHDDAAICCIEFLEKKALEGLKVEK